MGRASRIILEYTEFSYDDEGNMTVKFDLNDLYENNKFKNALVEIVDARIDRDDGFKTLQSELNDVIILLDSLINDLE